MYLLQTLGVLDVRSEDGTAIDAVLAQPKRAALLIYLALAPDPGWKTRDELTAVFWPDLDADRARNALNQAIHFLRRTLTNEVILSRADQISLNDDQVGCDAVELRRAANSGALEKALLLHRGDFLQGFHVADAPQFELWLTHERMRLREAAAAVADQLAQQNYKSGDLKRAVEFARTSSDLAPYDEERARELLRLLHEAGQHTHATSFYDNFVRRLAELELRPATETSALGDRIRQLATAKTQTNAGARAVSRTILDLETQVRLELTPELEVMRELGRGSMAIAFLAREPALKRLVTVKVMRRQLAADATARQRFEREGQAAARISHTNVASVYRVGRLQNDVPYLIVEYIDGPTLAQLIEARGRMSWDEARPILLGLAAALTAAHEQGVIHRDVRPANIFIENRSNRVVLTDFGIAALADTGTDSAAKLTPMGQPLGVAGYASPEQLSGLRAGESSDVYAFGMVARELLQGRAKARRVVRIETDVATVLQCCLAEAPERRPRAVDVLAMLRAAGPLQPM